MKKNSKRKCYKCLKILSIENFGLKFDSKVQKYYRINLCNECKRSRDREYYTKPSWAKKRAEYDSKGFYGWNFGWERHIQAKDYQLRDKNILSSWERKAQTLSDVSQNYVKKFKNKKIDHSMKKSEFQKLKTEVIKFMKSRRWKTFTQQAIIMEMYYYVAYRSEHHLINRFTENTWEKKIDIMTRSMFYNFLNKGI